MKLANIDKENIEISTKFSGRMCLITVLKFTKKQGFIPSLENTTLEKSPGGEGLREGGGGGSV